MTYRHDSLWWFAELYLHKERRVLALFRAIAAIASLLDRERPRQLQVEAGGPPVSVVASQLAKARGVAYRGPLGGSSLTRLLTMDARSTGLMLAAAASPGRPRRIPSIPGTTVAAFVHRAFWREGAADGSAESYIGPVLQALEAKLAGRGMRYVGIGPATNFRARKWWRRRRAEPGLAQPIEQLVPRAALAGSTGIWAARHAMRRALQHSADLRDAAVIGGCDCWPVVAEALAGVALLQFPWSARAMDEAGAALDALRPGVALTYAEAGGWGRALALEARRRGVPLAGLQHGFIYRHWLNYRHEADETEPPRAASRDRGFPRPTMTLVYDEYAASHLADAGRFPRDSIAVTGSPRLDGLAASLRTLSDADVDAAREAAGAGGRALVLLVTKYVEAEGILPALLDAMRGLPGAQLAIKTHPAETPAPYEAAAAGHGNVRVLPASAPLAPLLRAAGAVVTVNSTVALDAMALGIPALSIALPNNLSPFVEAGAIAGAAPGDIGPVLRRLLYDDAFRQQFCSASRAVAGRFRMLPAGDAAERQAAIVLGMARPPSHQEG